MQYIRKPNKYVKEEVTLLKDGVLFGAKGVEIPVESIKSIVYREHYNKSMSLEVKGIRHKILIPSTSFEDGKFIQKTDELELFLKAIQNEVKHDIIAERLVGSNIGFMSGFLLLAIVLFFAAAVLEKGGVAGGKGGKVIGTLIGLTVLSIALIRRGRVKKQPLC